jgi:hypothetical protein
MIWRLTLLSAGVLTLAAPGVAGAAETGPREVEPGSEVRFSGTGCVLDGVDQARVWVHGFLYAGANPKPISVVLHPPAADGSWATRFTVHDVPGVDEYRVRIWCRDFQATSEEDQWVSLGDQVLKAKRPEPPPTTATTTPTTTSETSTTAPDATTTTMGPGAEPAPAATPVKATPSFAG